MTELAEAVMRVLDSGVSKFHPLYELDLSIEGKIETIAREIYRADSVVYSSQALAHLRRIKSLGLDKLPVCLAKTQYSFSDDPKALGASTGFKITVNEVEIAAGAGFVIPILGKMMRMPGLPKIPAAEGMDIDGDGTVHGLS